VKAESEKKSAQYLGKTDTNYTAQALNRNAVETTTQMHYQSQWILRDKTWMCAMFCQAFAALHLSSQTSESVYARLSLETTQESVQIVI
jgi:hypothetical protein